MRHRIPYFAAFAVPTSNRCPGKRQGKAALPGTCQIFDVKELHVNHTPLLKRCAWAKGACSTFVAWGTPPHPPANNNYKHVNAMYDT